MPVSDYHQISDVLHVVEQVRPRSVLDVGVGFGKWGLLCREILELYEGRLTRESWARRIEGIEVYPPYRNPLWDLAYDQVHIGDATEVLGTLGRYDLIICCDVIEHLPKPAGHAFLRAMLDHCGVLILTSPRGFQAQSPWYGNEREAHRSGWGAADFAGLHHRYKDIGFTFMAVLANDPARLAGIALRQPLEVLGVKRGLVELLRMAAARARVRAGQLAQIVARPRGRRL